MTKPRELAYRIKNKFGSADNINTLSREYRAHTGILVFAQYMRRKVVRNFGVLWAV